MRIIRSVSIADIYTIHICTRYRLTDQYTLWVKNTYHFRLWHNFSKCWPIFTILSMPRWARNLPLSRLPLYLILCSYTTLWKIRNSEILEHIWVLWVTRVMKWSWMHPISESLNVRHWHRGCAHSARWHVLLLEDTELTADLAHDRQFLSHNMCVSDNRIRLISNFDLWFLSAV